MTTGEVKRELKEYKEKYEEAVKSNLEQFMYGGQFVVTNFAKYQIEHIENEIALLDDKLWHQ